MNSKRERVKNLLKKSGLKKYSSLSDEAFLRAYQRRDLKLSFREIFANEPLPRLTPEEPKEILSRRQEIEEKWIKEESGPPISREAARRIWEEVFSKDKDKGKKKPN